MAVPGTGQPEPEPWPDAVASVGAMLSAVIVLESDYPATLERLRRGLYGGERTAVLYLVRLLDEEYTLALLDDLVTFCLSERDGLLVREDLGRLPYADVEQAVPFAAWRLLEQENDAFAYQRIAHLLDHLGLGDARRELTQRALASDDPEVRRFAAEDRL
jgi:hypothetical protein